LLEEIASALTVLIDGGFFVWGDLSVKVEGDFRLKFTLFEMRKWVVLQFAPGSGCRVYY
jgi:hypothetical protein